MRRFDERGPVLSYEQLEDVYHKQTELTGYDVRIDNTRLTSTKVVEQVIAIWSR